MLEASLKSLLGPRAGPYSLFLGFRFEGLGPYSLFQGSGSLTSPFKPKRARFYS